MAYKYFRGREWREKTGLTQAQVSQRIGVARNVISDFERGERIPSVFVTHALAQLYGVPMEDMFGGTPPQRRPLGYPQWRAKRPAAVRAARLARMKARKAKREQELAGVA